MVAFPMKESFRHHFLLVVAALVVASVTAQSIIPAEILVQIPLGCHTILDDAADCVLQFSNFACWVPMGDLIKDLQIPDPDTADCFELQEMGCVFYDTCPACNEAFTDFADCLKQEFTPGVVTICDSASNSTDSNSTVFNSNSTDFNSTSTDTNSTDVGGCTNVTMSSDLLTCDIGPGECR